MTLLDRIQQTTEFILSRVSCDHPIGIILGTGLGGFVNEIEDEVQIPYSDIPHFPQSTVEGHDGKLIIGKLSGKSVIALKGRFHFYEGYSMEDVVYPIRVMAKLGVKQVVLSNASGGVNPSFKVGDIMIIKDHINLFPSNPLIGPNDERLGPRFPDMSEPYKRSFIEKLKLAAKSQSIDVQEGVYAGVSGPCFETPAEYKYLRIIGADAVGMSTVPEAIAAKHLGMDVAALSIITDLGIEGIVEEVSHEEVQKAAREAEPKMSSIVKTFLASI